MSKKLLYPCCGVDFLKALEFGITKGIEEFWFVDNNFPKNAHNSIRQSLKSLGRKILIERSIDLYSLDESESVLVYEFDCEGLKVRLIEENAVRVFDKYVDVLGAFFYRGDGMGEGGSGIAWLGSSIFPRVITKMDDSSYLITDGSNGSMSGNLDALCTFRGQTDMVEFSEEKYREIKEITTTRENIGVKITLKPEGYLLDRNSPTLIWALKKHVYG